MDGFWQKHLPEGEEPIPWAKVLQLLVVNRLIAPGSEFRVHRHWFGVTAMDELLGVDESVAAKDRLYRCLDRLLDHKDALFRHLQSRWKDLFTAHAKVGITTCGKSLCSDRDGIIRGTLSDNADIELVTGTKRQYHTNMQRLTEIAFEKSSQGIFTRAEVACWVGGSPQRQFSLVKRALASGEIMHLRRGLYCLAAKYLRHKVDPLTLAQRIYGPSYISLETALSYHGWIPEAVYSVTSVSVDRSREFETPLGHFSFTRVPQETFYTEVTRVEKDGRGNADGPGYGGGSGYGGPSSRASENFLLASPLKALADYVHVRKQDWNSSRPVVRSLRVDEGLLAGVGAEEFDRLLANYSSLRVRCFLQGMRKDLER